MFEPSIAAIWIINFSLLCPDIDLRI